MLIDKIKLIFLKINKINMSLRRQLNKKIDINEDIENKVDDINNSEDSLELKYIIYNRDLTSDDLNVLLNLISNSKFEGKDVNKVFELTLKLQYKLKTLEDKLNG